MGQKSDLDERTSRAIGLLMVCTLQLGCQNKRILRDFELNHAGPICTLRYNTDERSRQCAAGFTSSSRSYEVRFAECSQEYS